MCFFHAVGNKALSLFLIPFWRRRRFGDYPRTEIFPFASLFRLRSLLFRRVSPPPFSFPPLPLMEWLGLDPLIVISGSFFFFFFHPACIGQGSLYLPAPLHNALWQNGGRRIVILIPLFSPLPAVKKKSVARGRLLSPAAPKACEIIHACGREKNREKGGGIEKYSASSHRSKIQRRIHCSCTLWVCIQSNSTTTLPVLRWPRGEWTATGRKTPTFCLS